MLSAKLHKKTVTVMSPARLPGQLGMQLMIVFIIDERANYFLN